jgi:hypothetical protein
MNSDEYVKPPRCSKCGDKVMWLPYDGTGRPMCFDEWNALTTDDPDARRYVMYTMPDGEDRARVVTAGEPWDELCEHRIKQHLLSCARDYRNPRLPMPMREQLRTHTFSPTK